MRALVLDKSDDGVFSSEVTEMTDDELPDGEVTVAVEYSTINYKDGLAITDTSPIVRSWPMVPGVDFAGTVLSSSSDLVKTGDRVVLNGWDVGERHWGGLAERARVQGEWLTPLSEEFSTYHAAAIGTAGYTAMLSVLELERHDVLPESGPVVVTGAAAASEVWRSHYSPNWVTKWWRRRGVSTIRPTTYGRSAQRHSSIAPN